MTVTNQTTSPTFDVTQNPSSPYYLHPNDNLTLVLLSSALSYPNNHLWARAMRMVLLSKNKLSFNDVTLSAPATIEPLYVIWM